MQYYLRSSILVFSLESGKLPHEAGLTWPKSNFVGKRINSLCDQKSQLYVKRTFQAPCRFPFSCCQFFKLLGTVSRLCMLCYFYESLYNT